MPIKLYNPFPMAYGVCSEEKHVYELKDGKNTKSALTGLRVGLCCPGGWSRAVCQTLAAESENQQ